MNHFLLPGREDHENEGVVYGVHAMELVDQWFAAKRRNQEPPESEDFRWGTDYPKRAMILARQTLNSPWIFSIGKISSASAVVSGGDRPTSNVRFWPANGRARQMLLDQVEAPIIETLASTTPINRRRYRTFLSAFQKFIILKKKFAHRFLCRTNLAQFPHQ